MYGYAAVTDQIDEQVGIIGLGGAALLILAVVLLAPALCRLLLGPLSAPLVRLGVTGRLAAGNARRNPRWTAATASALMISLSVVTGLAIFGYSVKEYTITSVRRDVAAQLVVEPTGRTDVAIPQRTVEQLARVPGVQAVAALRYASLPMRVGPRSTQASARRCCIPSTQGRVKANLRWDQIAKTSSSNATATRRLVGSSTASS